MREVWRRRGAVPDGQEWDVGTDDIAVDPIFSDTLMQEAGATPDHESDAWHALQVLLKTGFWDKAGELLTSWPR